MSITMIHSNQPTVQLTHSTPLSKQHTVQADNSLALAADELKTKPLQRGVLPTVKGLAAGLVGGGLGAGAGMAILMAPHLISGGEPAAWAMLGVVMAAGYGAVAGTATGAVVANVTDNKLAATLGGAAIGAGAGALLGLRNGNVLFSAVIGAGAGAGGALAGALVAKR